MISNCKLVYSDGIASVFDEKGEPSNLYAQALVYAEGNQEYAVELWSATQTEEYENEVGEENPDLPVVLRFLNNREDNPKTLSTEELKEVSLMMSDMGITNIEEFTTSMNKMFQPNGYYAVDSKKLLKSGMFSSTDISEMNHEAVKAFLDKLNYFNTHKNFNLTSTPNKNKVMLRNTTAKKTPLGSYPMVSEQELVEYIVDKSEDLSEQSIRKAIGQSPFAQLLDDKKAMKAITGMLQGRTKVNKMFFDGQEFTINNISTFVTLRNTLLAEADPLELEADLEFVESIPENIWKSKAKEVKNVLREIEQTALKYNIDIVGLNELSEDRASVLELLSALDDMLLSPSMENIQNFAQKKDSKIGMDNPYTVVSIKDSYRNYNIVKIDTNLSDDMMFQRGFLRVSSNGLYHVVQRTNTSEMYEAVYEMVMDNELIIDSKYFAKDLNIKDPQYKEAVIDGITNYINSRDTGIESTLNEEISLFQTIFEHTPLNTVSPQEIESDPEYLKTGFVSDFYNYILQEKQANTDLYNKVLKYFAVTDADITLDALNTPDVTGIKFEQELRDYARTKKGGQIKSLNEYKTPSQDLLVINNPSLIKEEVATNYVTGNDGYILSEPNPETYMRVGGKLYRKLFDKANGALYKEVITPTSPLYFDNNLNFDYNRQEAEAAHTKLSEALPKPTIKSAQSLAEQVGIPTMFTPIESTTFRQQVDSPKLTEVSEDLASYNGMFSKDTTGVSFYDDVLNADKEDVGYFYFYKGIKGRVETMSPAEYLKRVRAGFNSRVDEGIVRSSVDKIQEAAESGNKINMPYLAYTNNSFAQEGRNRAKTAQVLEEKTIPVLIVEDVTEADKNNKAQEFVNIALKNGVVGEDAVIEYLKDNFNIHRDFVNFLRFKADGVNFEIENGYGDRTRWNPSRGNQTLEGAPIIKDATGADPELTYWAEEYARRNGIDYKRQEQYVEVDESFATRIAEEYDKMEHDPNNPEVKEAFDNLINQTKAQYEVLREAGYTFTFFDSSTDPYEGNPWNAMRDLRNNKHMAVYGTYDGFGTTGVTTNAFEDTPMLQDTGIVWEDQSGQGHKVLANDLFRCFLPGTLIRTKEGFKEIQDIEVGEYVLTHKGRYRKVYQTMKNPHKGRILNISTNASYNPIRVTPEHPFYMLVGNHGEHKHSMCTPYICDRKQSNGNTTSQDRYHSFDWVEANDLKEKMWFPMVVDSEIEDIDYIEIPKHLQKTRTKLPTKIELDEDMLTFIGLYIAEGSGGTNRININLHVKEEHLINLVRRVAKRLNYEAKERVVGNGIILQINCKVLRDWFSKWLGRGSTNKKIPNELMKLPNEKLNFVIKGIFEGDGKKGNNSIEQTSLTLALQLMEAGSRLGVQPTSNKIFDSVNKNHSPTYTTHEFLKTEHNYKQKKYTWKILGEDCRKITKIEEDVYEGFVYNIEVEEDHSYVVENVPVHNCIHDAFGHGLEGAGFRARGEENAWQSHVRLFTGSAIGAITSETRGQNSWLNFGKYAEQNQTAKIEDTIFAEQKTGLMPEWTWKKGLSGSSKISPSNSSNYANLTEDGQGNFVFYHKGAKGYKIVKPGKGVGTKTTKAEASALGKVGGLAMYYTRKEDGESIVSHQSEYMVKVPKDKVYDFNTDPLNLINAAKEAHDKENPEKAFDLNSQVAYITKLAGERGFDMVVSEWSGKTRAQTTKELHFIDTQELEGNKITKEFKENYISNTDKGWQPIIPKTKEQSIQEVLDEISNYREYRDKKYDSLYHIRDKSFRSKMTQEEVGTLINKSEMPQSLKDKYNEVVSAEELTRKSVIPTQTTFSEVVKDERVASQSKTMQGISDVDLVINNVYPKSQESDIKDKFDECRI